MKEVKMYKCETCGSVYQLAIEAQECEENHAALKDLRVDEISFRLSENTDRFPYKILVSDEEYSGEIAEYKLEDFGSVEDFYEKEEWRERIHNIST